VELIRKIIKNKVTTPKQRLTFLNWSLGLHFHQRTPDKREYLWPSELSGMLIKENGAWKLTTLHFTISKSNYPDERIEDTIEDYQTGVDKMKNKMIEHTGNKVDRESMSTS
jgi:hypothetical protein